MKRALIISLAGALTFPAFAGEQKKEAPSAATTQTAAPAVADSPLVQASKRSNRRNGKKTATIVITNESVRASKGHVTTSATQPPPLNVPEPKAGPEQQLAERQAKRARDEKRLEDARAEAAAKAKEHREKLRRNAAQQVEQGMYEKLEGDPASAEHVAETAGDKKPPR